MHNNYDVLIIGGGPAGLTAAYLLSKKGLNVALFEKDSYPREKLCGGLITQKVILHLENIFQNDIKFSDDNDIINFSTQFYYVFFKNKVVHKGFSKYKFYFIDREIYDTFLFHKAKAAGAKIFQDTKITKIDIEKSIISLENSNIKGKYLIGADGVNSIVRKEILKKKNYSTDKWIKNLATAIQFSVNKRDFDKEICEPRIYFGYIDWGYCWVFPNKEKIIIGMGGLNIKNKGKFVQAFNNFVNNLNIKNVNTIRKKSHPVPYGNFLSNAFYKNAILIGDAGGFVDPLTGEGIFYAHKSAELASISILEAYKRNNNLCELYQNLLKKFLLPDLVFIKVVRDINFGIFGIMKYFPSIIILKILEKKVMSLIHEEKREINETYLNLKNALS